MQDPLTVFTGVITIGDIQELEPYDNGSSVVMPQSSSGNLEEKARELGQRILQDNPGTGQPLQYHAFIERVRKQGHLQTFQEAEQLTKSVIETLGEFLDHPIRDHLSRQVPNELQTFLMSRQHEEYPLDEFYQRVGKRAKSWDTGSVKNTWLVMEILRENLPKDEVWEVAQSILNSFSGSSSR